MPLDFDVVIEADPAFLPFRVKIGLDRQLIECGALDLIEQRTPAGSQMPRSLSCVIISRMAALSSASEKKRRLRSFAITQRVAT
jgi:hypothetical protein